MKKVQEQRIGRKRRKKKKRVKDTEKPAAGMGERKIRESGRERN